MRTKSLMLATVLLASTALADTMTFSAGAIIIPEQSNFQDGCGSVSAYGLVWRILQSNQPGHYNAAHPVTVYWVVSSAKGSPNRCNPTNVTMPPQPRTGWSDPNWNDGCDAVINTPDAGPVTLVDFSGSWPATGIFPETTIPFYSNAFDGFPVYSSAGTLNHSTQAAWDTIQYMGGLFIIDASDAKNVFDFLKTGDAFVAVGTGQTGALSRFTSACTCQNSGTTADPNCHHVNIHQATATFSAEVGKRMNQTPPRLALLDTASHAGADGGVNNCGGNPTSGTGCDKLFPGILDGYLSNAGLLIGGACAPNCSVGCPQGSFAPGCVNAGTNGSTSGSPKSGLIYDQFDSAADLISTAANPYGLLNHTTSGKLDYKVFWTPHWEASGSPNYVQYVPNGDGAATQRDNALNNIAHFADQRGAGLMAECASVDTYETGYDKSQSLQSPSGITETATRFQFTNALVMNGLSHTNWTGRNCTDPDYNTTGYPTSWGSGAPGECAYYPNPGNIFSQIGDFTYSGISGHLKHMKPDFTKGSNYRAGIQRLATSWDQYRPGRYPSNTTPCDPTKDDGTCDSGWDFFTMSYKNNDPKKATIVYIGGHDWGDGIVGNRIILNTLFALGADPLLDSRTASVPVPFINEFGDDLTGSGTRVLSFTSLYKSVSGYAPGVQTFNASTGSAWVFPYVPGDIAAHSLVGGGALTNGENDLINSATTDGVNTWDGETQLGALDPGQRNIFTYFGGYVSTNTARPQVNDAPSKVLQIGWTPEAVDGTVINQSFGTVPNPNCTDVMKLGNLPFSLSGQPTKGLIHGSDGICDLQEAVQSAVGINAGNGGSDPGNQAAYVADFDAVRQMLQKVRGYCFANSTQTDGDPMATPVLTPTQAQCNDPDADNKAHLGGIVYSAPAIIPYSPNITDVGGKRPTVAYASGYDGMLHAFYVAGGSNYQGTSGLHFRHQSPANDATVPGLDGMAGVPRKFNHKWLDSNTQTSATSFSPPVPMTELWAFMPASQLPNLKNNNTKLDASPVVQDVCGKWWGGPGQFYDECHTVLVGTAGSVVNGTYSEVYAIDITNPLKPVLLWDLLSNWDAGGAVPSGTFPPGLELVADKNNNNCNGDCGQANNYGKAGVWKWDLKNADFYTDPADSDTGRKLTFVYDYSEMGAAQALSMVTFKPQLAVPPHLQGEQVTSVFVNANAGKGAPFSDGQEMYGIDVLTGQKLWQSFVKLHDGDDDNYHHHGITANAVPPGASLFYDDLANDYTLLVGDNLGRVWSLDPGAGTSTYLMATKVDKHGKKKGCGSHGGGHGCGCPAVISDSDDDDPQPVSTLVSVGRVPSSAGGIFASHRGEQVILFGTGGTKAAYDSAHNRGEYVHGRIHIGLLRAAVTCDDTARLVTGVAPEPSGFPYKFTTNDVSVTGDISVSGQIAWFSTVNGYLGDLFAPVTNVSGSFYAVDLGGSCDATLFSCIGSTPIGKFGTYARGSYGGAPLVVYDKQTNQSFAVATQTQRIDVQKLPNNASGDKAKPNLALSVNGAGKGANGSKGVVEWLKFRLR